MSDETLSSWLIELYFTKTQKSVKFRLQDRAIIGRGDSESGAKPDVDLNHLGAEQEGVSRHHLQIAAEDGQLVAKDLHSGNGTTLNGTRLEPDQTTPIKHSDILQLGQMEAQLRVVISPTSSSSIRGQQRSLQLQDQEQAGTGQTVLIVEDDDMVSKLLSLMLERAGYTIVVSRNVSSAIRLFKQKPPSAVILDLMLPDMNGMELCRYIRRDTQQNATPVIVVSAINQQELVDQAMQAGADIFLSKPISSKELRHVVGSLINHKEKGVASLHTKHLIGTAPLRALEPRSRRDTLVLFISGYNDAPITVNLRQPTTIGRQANPNSKAHIDLSRFEAVDLGVSRLHATLSLREENFFLEDNGSINGTYLNGEPIKANKPMQLRNADEIRLGQLRMYAYFLTDNELQNMQVN